MGTTRVRKIVVAALTAVLAMSLFAGAAMAKQPDKAERGNSLRSEATQVELTQDDIRFQTFDGIEYVAVDHNIGDYDQLVWREPTRLGGQNVVSGAGSFNTLYLGVSGPEGGEVAHKGQVSIYYEVDGEWLSIVAQFNGQGELLWVNGVEPVE